MNEEGIKIGEKFTVFHDGLQWVMVQHPKTGNRHSSAGQLMGHRRYYGDIEVLLRAAYNHGLKGARSIKDIERLTGEHFTHIARVGEDIRAAVQNATKRVLDI